MRFLLRDHLFAEMRQFMPNIIILSYSGRIHIENDHFVEIMQELSKISPRVILYPNLSSHLFPAN